MRNTEPQLDHIITLFLSAMTKYAITWRETHFPELNRQTLDFLHPIELYFTLQRHVLSTAGDALSGSITSLWPAKKPFLSCLLA
jgi:hypothetical protein